MRSLGPWRCNILETINHNICNVYTCPHIFAYFHDFFMLVFEHRNLCVFTFFAYVFLASCTSVHVKEIKLHTHFNFHLHIYLFDFCFYFDIYLYICVDFCVRVCVSMCFLSMFVSFQNIPAIPALRRCHQLGVLLGEVPVRSGVACAILVVAHGT